MTDYKIVLQSLLDLDSLKKQLDDINKKGEHSLKIKLEIDQEQLNQLRQAVGGITRTIGSSGGATKPGIAIPIDIDIDKEFLTDAGYVEEKLKELRGAAIDLNKVTLLAEPDGKVVGVLAEYTNEAKQAVTETLRLNEAGTKLEITSVKAIDNIGQRRKEETRLIEAERKEMEKSLLAAEKFLERAKGLQQSPQVRQATGVAGGIKAAVAEGDINKVRELNKQLQVLDAGIRQSGVAAWSWQEQMKVAIQRTMEWASAVSIVYGAFRQLQQGIQYVKELNNAMTSIQVVTGNTSEETNKMAFEFNNLGKELGATTKQIADGSLEWIRQGKTAEETRDLLKSTMMLSKLGALDAAQATEYLTSTLNGFQLQAEDANKVVDTLISLDNSAATSAGEIASAMSRSATSAQQAGVSFNELASYITVLSSTTRRSSESIGESLWVLGAIEYNS